MIAVHIGRLGGLYYAYVTTAPTELDAPSTMTIYAGTLGYIAGFAADPIGFEPARASAPARLVLVNATDRTSQHSRYRREQHVFAPADPVLVGLNELQHWLWQRLHAPLSNLRDASDADSPGGQGR